MPGGGHVGPERTGVLAFGEAANADRAVDLAMHHHPDVALLDINMPGNGIRAARDISAALPNTAVVMLTASTDDADHAGPFTEYGERRLAAQIPRLKGTTNVRELQRVLREMQGKRDFDGEVTEAKGRRMAKGICPVCGTKMNRILGKA